MEHVILKGAGLNILRYRGLIAQWLWFEITCPTAISFELPFSARSVDL
jgi:hypothetical protein